MAKFKQLVPDAEEVATPLPLAVAELLEHTSCSVAQLTHMSNSFLENYVASSTKQQYDSCLKKYVGWCKTWLFLYNNRMLFFLPQSYLQGHLAKYMSLYVEYARMI